MQKLYKFLIEAKKDQSRAAEAKGRSALEEGAQGIPGQSQPCSHTHTLVQVLSQCPPSDLEALVKSPQGSKLMQDILSQFCSKDLLLVLTSNLVLYQESLYRLMTNKYSNYFVQVFVSKCTTGFKEKILFKLFDEFKG